MRIDIKGPIISDSDQWIYDYFDIPAVSPKVVIAAVDEAVKNKSNELKVVINSGGGSVFAGSEIYTTLKSFDGEVNVNIVGIAASAASVIAMAGKVSMSPTAQLMIHNSSMFASGDYRDMDHASEFLQSVNKSISNAYALKTNKGHDELKVMMDKETWMTAQQALENGFIDNIMFESEVGAVANANEGLVDGVLPKEVIEKVRNELMNSKKNQVVNQVNPAENVGKNEGVEKMDLEKLKNEHPDLFEEVKALGFDEGVKVENARIKSIEELELPGNEALINKAKFETKDSAEVLAVQIIKAEKSRGANFLENRNDDAKELDQVPGDHAPEGNGLSNEAKVAENGKNIAGIMNKIRGGK